MLAIRMVHTLAWLGIWHGAVVLLQKPRQQARPAQAGCGAVSLHPTCGRAVGLIVHLWCLHKGGGGRGGGV